MGYSSGNKLVSNRGSSLLYADYLLTSKLLLLITDDRRKISSNLCRFVLLFTSPPPVSRGDVELGPPCSNQTGTPSTIHMNCTAFPLNPCSFESKALSSQASSPFHILVESRDCIHSYLPKGSRLTAAALFKRGELADGNSDWGEGI